MSSPDFTGWLLTYAVHSTVLLVFAWVATSRASSHRVRETLWKTALFGGFFTATGQSVLRVSPLAGRMVVPAAALPETTGTEPLGLASGAIASRPVVEAVTGDVSSPVTTPPALPRPGTLVLLGWGLGVALLLGRYLMRRARFLRRIGDRRSMRVGFGHDEFGIQGCMESARGGERTQAGL